MMVQQACQPCNTGSNQRAAKERQGHKMRIKMDKTIKEMLNEPHDMKWVENPNVTPGLAEKLDAAIQKHHRS